MSLVLTSSPDLYHQTCTQLSQVVYARNPRECKWLERFKLREILEAAKLNTGSARPFSTGWGIDMRYLPYQAAGPSTGGGSLESPTMEHSSAIVADTLNLLQREAPLL